MAAPATGQELSAPELDERLKDYGLFEDNMTADEKIELFDTLEKSKLSAQQQAKFLEEDSAELCILPSSPFLRKVPDPDVSVCSGADSPLIGGSGLPTRQSVPHHHTPPRVSGGRAVGRSPHVLRQTPARPRVPSPDVDTWDSASSSSSLVVTLSQSPSRRSEEGACVSSFSPKSPGRNGEVDDFIPKSPVTPPRNTLFREEQYGAPLAAGNSVAAANNLASSLKRKKSPVRVGRRGFSRISSSDEDVRWDNGIVAVPASVEDRPNSAETGATEGVHNGTTVSPSVHQPLPKAPSRAGHVTTLLADRHRDGGAAELLRVLERLQQLEQQYCGQQAGNQECQKRQWPDPIAPTRGLDQSTLALDGEVLYKSLRLDGQQLRQHIASGNDPARQESHTGFVQQSEKAENTPSMTKIAPQSPKRKFFRRRPVEIPVVKGCPTVSAKQPTTDHEVTPTCTMQFSRVDYPMPDDDGTLPGPESTDPSRAHARSSRLLMQSLSTQKKSASAHRLSLKLRQRGVLSVAESAETASRQDRVAAPAVSNRAGVANPPELPTLPTEQVGTRRRKRLKLASDSEESSGATEKQDKREDDDVIRPATLKFPRKGKFASMPPVVTRIQEPTPPRTPRSVPVVQPISDDDDVEAVFVSPPPATSTSRLSSGGSTCRRDPASVRLSESTPLTGSAWLSSLTPPTAARSRPVGTSDVRAGGRELSDAASSRVSPGRGGSQPAPESGLVAPTASAAKVQIQCPICCCMFSREDVEAHASQCMGDVMEIQDSPPPPAASPHSQRTTRSRTPEGFQRCRLCWKFQREGQEFLAHVEQCVHRRREETTPSGSRLGVSPSSTFQRISAQSDSCIDYHNQFPLAGSGTPRRGRRVAPGERRGRGRKNRGARSRRWQSKK